MHDVHQEHSDHGQFPALQTVHAALLNVRSKIVGLIRAWSQPKERYADLRSRARTPQALELIARIREGIEDLEEKGARRVRRRREKSGVKFSEAIERFVGDLLRVKAGTTMPALISRATGKSHFKHDPVKYDMFMRALEGLKGLGLVGHQRGQASYRKTMFGFSVQLSGRGARFWATGKLLALAGHCGITSGNVRKHFSPEPPKHPLVLRDYAAGRGSKRERGKKIEYEHTTQTKRLEAGIRELNEFLMAFEITGGGFDGYTRNFNNHCWAKGGRLYCVGEDSYQSLPEAQRLKMTVNGEHVAEIDIKASHLTIYHAMIGQPLEGSSDPYALAGVDRTFAKLWAVASFGSSRPVSHWPEDMAAEYKDDTHKDLSEQADAKDIRRKMLRTFPALKKLKEHFDIWADLQFLEAEAVIGTMLILMREYRVPSLSMHDGLIVPRSKADLAKTILAREFHRVVGVEPILTIDIDPTLAPDL